MFAGLIDPHHDQKTANQLLALAALPEGLATIPYDAAENWQNEDHSLVMVQQRRFNSVDSKRTKGMVSHAPSQTRIVAWARIDNRDELIGQLPADLLLLSQSDEGLILACYLHWAESASEHLVGDFTFAIYDARDHSFYCGRDHTGVKPFYYYFDGKQFAFATSIAVLDKLPAIDLTLSEPWLVQFLVGASQDWSKTVYQHIYKLPPAHTLKFFCADLKIVLRQYFTFSSESDLILGSDEEYVEAYREALHQAVACRVNSDYPVGSESSGGLDSSTITALAARYIKRPGRNLHAFGYDEAELTPGNIIAVSQRTPLSMTHFISNTRGSDEHIKRRFSRCNGVPEEHANAISHHNFYEVAQKLGIRTLLSGFGGDEFVTSAAPVALVEFWQNRDWSLFFSRQRGKFLKPLHAARWLYQYYRHQNQSITSRRFALGRPKFWDTCLVHDEVVERHQLKAIMANNTGYDGGKVRQNDFALQDRWSPMMTARYENCTLMAAHYGIDYRWPLMDIRLLKLFLSIPASQKLGPGLMGRYLHRRAVADVLPETITWSSKDMEPFYFWKRLGMWAGETPLIRAFKRDHIALTPSTKIHQKSDQEHDRTSSGQITMNSGQASHTVMPELDTRITALLDMDKMQQANKLLASKKLTKGQRILLKRHFQAVNSLNQWLTTASFLKSKTK